MFGSPDPTGFKDIFAETGGAAASGWASAAADRMWLAQLARLVGGPLAHVIAKSDISGPINATEPIPVTNLKCTEELARRLHPPHCCAASVAISLTSFCWAVSACCRTRR
jgi:hypothetical protein